MPITDQELIDAAVGHGLVTNDQVIDAQQASRQSRTALLDTIVSNYRIPRRSFYHAVSLQRNIPFVDLARCQLAVDLVEQLPDVGIQRGIVPAVSETGEIVLATIGIDDMASISAVQRSLNLDAPIVLAEPEAVLDAVSKMQSIRQSGVTPDDSAENATALLNRIVNEAYLRRASDIHVEPIEDFLQIRLRVDGKLQVYMRSISSDVGHALVTRIKVLAELDIAERRAPQDGRILYPLQNGLEQSTRVAVIPTRHGERVTIRLLSDTDEQLTLTNLGLLDEDLAALRRAIKRPYGIVLLTGPTGSGKSTTLYSALREINDGQRNIMTVEDPVEQLISGISQIQVGGSDKITFGSALRSLLRHDPDVMMVGEIRDLDTADISLKAALTGHLVFSSLHTNTAIGAVTRLMDFGCEPYLVGATLAGSIAQRLVRRLCTKCRSEAVPNDAQKPVMAQYEIETLYESSGCPSCLGSGYHGRIGLFECFWTDESTQQMIARQEPESTIREYAKSRHTSLLADGIKKVELGITSLDEVMNATIGGDV
tara:strand:- start:2475 stop:4094 length:1620 start_codon:yes stop_codon:yes gene_type:complete